ncbi:MAG: radical SAM protein [Thermotaleaceae bacterium]
MGKKHYIIPVFVPHKGCPYDCVFCNQKKITGQKEEISAQKVDQQIRQYLSTMSEKKDLDVEVAFYGGSFTGIEQHRQAELLAVAQKWKKRGVIKDVRISTRPDYIDQSILSFLTSFGVTIIELGVQSMDIGILETSCRGHSPRDVILASKAIQEKGIFLGHQIMIGLPGDTMDTLMNTADAIVDLKPDFVRIYPTLVIKDTHLEMMYLNKSYQPMTLEDAIIAAKNLMLKFLKYDIPVIRLGLQPTEDITLGKEVIAGPIHPSFRQLVEGEIYRNMLEIIFKKLRLEKNEHIEIQGNDGSISPLVGQSRRNIKYLQKEFQLKKITIRRNNNLEKGTIVVQKNSNMLFTYSMKEYASNTI